MKGYRNNPVATALTLDDQGWLHTADIGHVGAGGTCSWSTGSRS